MPIQVRQWTLLDSKLPFEAMPVDILLHLQQQSTGKLLHYASTEVMLDFRLIFWENRCKTHGQSRTYLASDSGLPKVPGINSSTFNCWSLRRIGLFAPADLCGVTQWLGHKFWWNDCLLVTEWLLMMKSGELLAVYLCHEPQWMFNWYWSITINQPCYHHKELNVVNHDFPQLQAMNFKPSSTIFTTTVSKHRVPHHCWLWTAELQHQLVGWSVVATALSEPLFFVNIVINGHWCPLI